MSHSHEEIRAAALDILAGRVVVSGLFPTQFDGLRHGIGQIFAHREGHIDNVRHFEMAYAFDDEDQEKIRELFWNLFREGVITLGISEFHMEFPYFRMTDFGRRIAADGAPYFLHYLSTYESGILKAVPDIHPTTMLYLKEAMLTFRSGAMLSVAVMLGVAAEHTFSLLLERVEHDPRLQKSFARVSRERGLLRKINALRKALESIEGLLPADVREDLDTRFAGILSVLRTFRNESGHPTGKAIGRDEAYILLNMFPFYCQKVYQLMHALSPALDNNTH